METCKKVIVLAPHPDDGEFGAGGSIKKLTDHHSEVWYVMFSRCEKSLPPEAPKDTLVKELHNAAQHLGIQPHHIIEYSFPVREFPSHRQEILDALITLRNNHSPDLVLLPNSTDIHQDHQVINQEGIRAFKHSKLLGYELPWNNTIFTSNFHISLTDDQLASKYSAIEEYKSQTNRPYSSFEFIKSLARVRGLQANTDFAEAFELIRWNID